MRLSIPNKLKPGDKVATVSLSWGGAGDPSILWRYQVGKKRLQDMFGLEVVEMPNTLKGSQYLYEHPEKRAEDLMLAFSDPSIKGIFSCIGGDESVRLLLYIDYDVIRENPKVFLGYSDSTVTHFICLKAGLSSFYGPSVLAEFAENVEVPEYTRHWVHKTLMDTTPIGNIPPSPIWTSEYLPWDEKNRDIKRKFNQHSGYELLQGEGMVKGHLIGGCMDVLEMLKGTEVWPELDMWKGGILFLETSEDKPEPTLVEYWLRNYGSIGILANINGIIFAKPYDNAFYNEYKKVFLKVVKEELKLDIPILFNMNFGHTAPMFLLPLGATGEIDCDRHQFSILDPGVR